MLVKVREKLLEVAERFKLISDYVVETETKNGWVCRKYASGITVAYLNKYVSGVAATATYNSYNYVSSWQYITLPETIDSQDNVLYLNGAIANINYDLVSIRNVKFTSDTQLAYRIYNPISLSGINYYLNVCIVYKQ